jgi:flagellar basal-body rod modification protein FlgD
MSTTATTSTTSTNPFAALSGNSSSSSTSKSSEAGSQDRFLTLLVAQMKNQDPLNPMDNAQVTSQMAQINTVSGLEKLNTTVAGLSAQFVQMQALQGASLVGHDVLVEGNKLSTDAATGKLAGGFELPGAADQVQVEILDGAGRVLDTVQLGAQTTGRHDFEWAQPADKAAGATFRITATSGATKLATTALMTDRVEAVSTSGQALQLQLGRSGAVSYDAVKAFN